MTEKYKLEISEKEAYDMLEKNFQGEIKNLFNSLEIDEETGTC